MSLIDGGDDLRMLRYKNKMTGLPYGKCECNSIRNASLILTIRQKMVSVGKKFVRAASQQIAGLPRVCLLTIPSYAGS
jgi:hypothetical protein